ncbi:MAG TPA: hypothetical protein VFS75_01930 [Candidatus Paceibacterota bacterium]|nr:hypothetical protein [Candidatus Paceibacterota bacterium]
MTRKTVVRMGAIAATFRPGFKARPAQSVLEYYLLPLSNLVSEAVALGTIDVKLPQTVTRRVPGYADEQQLYRVDSAVIARVASEPSFSGHYKLFVRMTEGGPLYRYRSDGKKVGAKTRRAKGALKRTRPTVREGA